MNNGRQLSGSSLHQRQTLNKNIPHTVQAPVVICDGLQNPENLGSILRVADAIGCQKILLVDCQINTTHKKISKLARSTDKNLVVENLSKIEFLNIHSQFKHIIALEITTTSKNLYSENILSCDALIIGHESSGISKELLSICPRHIHIPMYGINSSMNISHALSVFLYEWRRQTPA